MRRSAVALVLLTALGGCMSLESSSGGGGGGGGNHPPVRNGVARGPASVPGVVGPMGTPVPMAQPYASMRPGASAARDMINTSMPLSMVQMHNPAAQGPGGIQLASAQGMPGEGLIQANVPPGGGQPPIPAPPGGFLSPPGLPPIPGGPGGPMGGFCPPSPRFPPGAVAYVGGMADKSQIYFPVGRTQVRFTRPSGMKVSWFTTGADGRGMFAETPIEVPGRYNFAQAAIYRLKLTNVEGRPGLEVYPTLEVVPANPSTQAFLAHSAVPLEFSPEDFRQIAAGNYVVKVIYLPNPQNQDVAGAGLEEIISTQLEPGADPIAEARSRGSILLVIRMGNVDQNAPNTPALQTPPPGGNSGVGGMMMPGPNAGMMPPMPPMAQMPPMGPGGPMGPGAGPMGPGAGPMVPYGAAPPGMMPRPPFAGGGMPPGMVPPTTGMAPPNGQGGPVMVPPQAPMQPPPPPPGVVPASGRMISAATEDDGVRLASANVPSYPPPPPASAHRPPTGSIFSGFLPGLFRGGNSNMPTVQPCKE